MAFSKYTFAQCQDAAWARCEYALTLMPPVMMEAYTFGSQRLLRVSIQLLTVPPEGRDVLFERFCLHIGLEIVQNLIDVWRAGHLDNLVR